MCWSGIATSTRCRRRAVELLLRDEEWSKKSDRWIADQCAVSNRFVGNVRQETTVNRSQLSSDERLGQDGKTRRMPERQPEPVLCSAGHFAPALPGLLKLEVCRQRRLPFAD